MQQKKKNLDIRLNIKAFHLVGMDPLRLTFLSKYASYVGSDKFLFGLFLIKAAFVH